MIQSIPAWIQSLASVHHTRCSRRVRHFGFTRHRRAGHLFAAEQGVPCEGTVVTGTPAAHKIFNHSICGRLTAAPATYRRRQACAHGSKLCNRDWLSTPARPHLGIGQRPCRGCSIGHAPIGGARQRRFRTLARGRSADLPARRRRTLAAGSTVCACSTPSLALAAG